ncbi:MAG: hypothetical protein OEP52_13155, partial [Acidimicrobiia bacterium]|nr:hypothetical protein [Acidimicrobiia bacterium]
DDAIRSAQLFADSISQACVAGRARFEARAQAKAEGDDSPAEAVAEDPAAAEEPAAVAEAATVVAESPPPAESEPAGSEPAGSEKENTGG